MFRYLLGHLRTGTRHAVRGAAAAALAGAASSAWALGLGDIELNSALNEKLDAEIELLDVQGLQPTEIIVSLASAEDFERVGVERFFFLTDLRFEVSYGEDGVRHVEVSSTQPVTEPYLNFLVEVLWPQGRLLKEFTLLLDPPTFSPAPAPSVAAPARADDAAAEAGRVQRESTAPARSGTRVQMPARPQTTQPSPLDDGVVDGEYRMTDRSDTLWSIASRTRPSERVTVNQNMLAIQRLNPEAFLNGNINLLKAGYTLRLPNEQQALALTDVEAAAQVAMQNEDWRALQRGEPVPDRGGETRVAGVAETAAPALQSPLDATPEQPRQQAAADAGDGELRIVAGEGDSVAGSVDAAAATQRLDAALEEQDRLSRELEELTAELDRERELASNQIAVRDRQLEVRDQQIAEMQAEIERLRQQMAEAQSAQSQNQSAPSSTQAWWQSPYALGGAAGLVVLLLVYGLVAARRRREEAESFDLDDVAEQPAEPAVAGAAAPAATAPAAAAATLGAQADEHEAAPLASAESETETVDEAETAAETSDVIGEADIYIAYGRYPQAIGLLLGVLEDEPDRNDVRLKLLELYAETRDREGFDTHMAELVGRCDDEEVLLTARELAQQFGDADARVEPAAPGAELTDEPVGEPAVAAEPVETAPGEAAPEQPLALDELEPEDESRELEPLEFTRNGDAAADAEPAAAGSADAAPADAAEEFELELDELLAEEAEQAEEATLPEPAQRDSATAGAIVSETPSADSTDDLGGDLGIDFDPERDVADAPRANGDTVDDLDFDLDLDDVDALTDEAFDFEDEGDTASTKLDLARAYIDMGDQDGARDILNEVLTEGNAEQQQRAKAMLEEL